MALKHEIAIYKSDRKNFKIRVSEIIGYYYYIMYPDFKYRGESHNFYEIFMCLSGEIEAHIDNEVCILTDKSYIVHNKNTFHAHNANKKMATTISIGFDASGLKKDIICDKVGKFDDMTFSIVEVLTTKISQYLNTPEENKPYGYEEFLINSLELILVNIQGSFLQKQEQEKKYIGTNKFTQYIMQNYNKKIDLDAIANEFNYSIGHICKKFKKENNMTVVDYITQVRLANAILMMEKDMTISEIAVGCGFNDIYSFSKIFKKYIKTSPSTYKSNAILKKHMHFENLPKTIRNIIESINKEK